MDDLKDMILNHAPKLPEDFEQLVIDKCTVPFIFRYKGNRAYCNGCHREFDTDRTDYRVQDPPFVNRMHTVVTARHGENAECPFCHSKVRVFDGWRGRKNKHTEAYAAILLPMTDGGVMIRSFAIFFDYSNFDNPLVTYSEHYRVYLNKGVQLMFKRDATIAYNEHYWGWPPCLLYCSRSEIDAPHAFNEIKSMREPKHPSAVSYINSRPETAYINFTDETLSKSFLKYCRLDPYMAHCEAFCPVTFLRLSAKYPVIEKFIQQGFYSLIDGLIANHTTDYGGSYIGRLINWRKPTVKQAMKVDRKAYKRLRAEGDIGYCRLEAEHIGKLLKCREDEITHLQSFKYCGSYDLLKTITEHITFHKLFKYIEDNDIIASDYFNYYEMAEKLGSDLTSRKTLLPSDFTAAHDGALQRLNEIKEQKAREEEKQKKLKFEKALKRYIRQYTFCAGGLLIRPFENSEEIYKESVQMKHCVYKCYKDKYLRCETILLTVRSQAEPGKPLVTVEMSLEEKIIQCRGVSNTAPPENVSRFIEQFKEYLRNGERKAS